MDKIITELVKIGSMASIFIAALLVALVIFVAWAKKLVEQQLTQKDARILALEKGLSDVQEYIKGELHQTLIDTQKIMIKSNDTFSRLERHLEKL